MEADPGAPQHRATDGWAQQGLDETRGSPLWPVSPFQTSGLQPETLSVVLSPRVCGIWHSSLTTQAVNSMCTQCGR